jgi:BirA family biotin operon repressor/biotin-[acetyl-CoA-carboxylase] ligase
VTTSDLTPAAITARLATQRYGRSLDVRARTGSTNDDARAAAEGGAPDGHVVLANTQDAGRGALGHTWSSPAGTDLYLSVVDRPAIPTLALPQVTLAVGLGVAECVEEFAGRRALVKWPNDVLAADAAQARARKCAGILVETTSVGAQLGALVIGVGLDVNRAVFEGELGETATSLHLLCGRTFERAEVLARLLLLVETWVDRLVCAGGAPVVAALDERLAWRGARVVCGEVSGELLGLDASGALRVATGGGVRTLRAGSLRLA